MTADISFSPLASDQVSLLLEWFAKPHVSGFMERGWRTQ